MDKIAVIMHCKEGNNLDMSVTGHKRARELVVYLYRFPNLIFLLI